MTAPRSPADDADSATDEDASAPGMPRWVKVLGGIAAAIVLIAIVAMLVSGGEHGPGRHGVERAGLDAAA
jgi:hypothetical protein